MKERKKNSGSKNASVKKEESKKFETMSQSQNRHGRGRERNGSDGGAQVTSNKH